MVFKKNDKDPLTPTVTNKEMLTRPKIINKQMKDPFTKGSCWDKPGFLDTMGREELEHLKNKGRRSCG